MPRAARIARGGMVLHVLNRGDDRRTTFEDNGDYEAFLRMLRQTQQAAPMRVLALCTSAQRGRPFARRPVGPSARTLLGLRARRAPRGRRLTQLRATPWLGVPFTAFPCCYHSVVRPNGPKTLLRAARKMKSLARWADE